MKTSTKIYRFLFQKQYPSVLLLLLLAGALLAAGIILGENGLVERNAHYLCLDCMGIG
jgi:hypothetical protein